MSFLEKFFRVKKYIANNDTRIIHSINSKTCNINLILDFTHVTEKCAHLLMDKQGYTFCRRCGTSLSK